MEYYKLKDIEKRDFYKIYKELFSNKSYIKISAEAKWAYIILVDKLDMAKTDNDGSLYFKSIRGKMQKLLHLSVNTVTKVLKELASVGLILESKQGFGEVKKTYVKKMKILDIEQVHKNSEDVTSAEVIEKPREKALIGEFTNIDIEDAKIEVREIISAKDYKKVEKILNNIEIKSFLGYDAVMISTAIEVIVRDLYQDERVKNIKKLTKTIANYVKLC